LKIAAVFFQFIDQRLPTFGVAAIARQPVPWRIALLAVECVACFAVCLVAPQPYPEEPEASTIERAPPRAFAVHAGIAEEQGHFDVKRKP
jgi:hypothetical protein